MRRSAATLIVAWLLGAPVEARAQREPADAGVERAKQGAKPQRAGQRPPSDPGGDDPKLTTTPPATKGPPGKGTKTRKNPAAEGTKAKNPAAERAKAESSAAGTAPKGAPEQKSPATAEDGEVIRNLEMLLLLDLLGDYDLFDEEGGDGGTFSDPGGLKEYRP